ncbi:MAG: T9SS type A sorting domain-containing protein [Bacteroidales bacterium]|nr:T9SS type A sorting domain-containing protein [Bacteroidales bacterium]
MRIITLLMCLFLVGSNIFPQSCEESKHQHSTAFSRPFAPKYLALHNNYDQKFIHINIEANDSNRFITNTVHYTLKAKASSIEQVYFEFSPTFTIDSVSINQQPCTYYYSADTLILYPSTPIASYSLFEVSISYRGDATSGGEYRGLTNTYSSDYNQHITWTLSESFHLKDWLPCKQDLGDRLDSAWIFITVDSTCKAGSEGRLTAITPLPNGKMRYEWKEHHPIVYYLLSIAVGKFAEYSFYVHIPGLSDSLLVMNYIYKDPQCLIDNKTDIDRTGDFLRIYSDKFGLYPFADEKYGHCQVPLGGGMEHQTMTTLGFFVHWLVAHEMAHMWFGDHITCANWQDIWINEGFASYGEYIILQNYFDQATADVTMRHFQFRARKEPEGSIYVPFEVAWDENRIFNGNLSYKKGAALIHMIRYLCNNDSVFFYGLKQLQNIYGDSVLTGADVRDLYEQITGIDFHPLFDQYYYGKGFPIYNIRWWQNSTQNLWNDLIIHIEQRGSSQDNNLFTIPLPFRIYHQGNYEDVRLPISQNIEIHSIATQGQKIDSVQFDPQNWILDSLESFSIAIEPLAVENEYFTAYPNPASNFIMIDCNKPMLQTKIELYSMDNKKIFETKTQEFPFIHPLNSSFSNGVYFLKIKTLNRFITQKIVIKKQ